MARKSPQWLRDTDKKEWGSEFGSMMREDFEELGEKKEYDKNIFRLKNYLK